MEITSRINSHLSTVNPVLEGFITIGVTSQDLNAHLNYEEPLTPKVLSRFPPDYKYPETLPIFCFPTGYKAIKTSPEELESETFNFILTDETGSQLYCAAMIIYESAGSEKEQSTVFQTQVNDIIIPSKDSAEDSNKLAPSLESHVRRSQSFSKITTHKSPNTPQARQTSFKFFSKEAWLVPKCLLMITKYPFLETLKKLLTALFKLIRTHLTIPIESYIAHLFMLLPMPPRGCIEVVYQMLGSVVLLKVPPVNQLPLYDSNMTVLFQTLSVPMLLKVFTHLLLEENVVFLSSSNDKLFCCSYTLLSLLYPFKWCLVYVPVLPSQLVDYLYSPVKYVYGINSKLKEDVLIRCTSEVCIVDLDTGKLENNDEMFNIHSKKKPEKANVALPEHYSKKLTKQLLDNLYTKENTLKRITADKVAEIRSMFFQFFVAVFQNYKTFLNYEKSEKANVLNFFDEENFLLKNKTDKDFFKVFFKTQMFVNFCERNIHTVNMDQHFENLLFNEHIIAKKNRSGIVLHKKPTLFISDTSQNIKSKYMVPPPETCFGKQGSHFYYIFPNLDYEVFENYGMPIKSHPRFTENSINIPDTRNFHRQRSVKQSRVDSLFVIWLELWASCLWTQDEVEHNERIIEVISVLDKMNKGLEKPTIAIYTFLIETCFNVNPSVALSIFSYMNTINVLVDATTVLILQKVISKLFSTSKGVNLKSTRHSIEIHSEAQFLPSKETIRKRVFNMKNKKILASHGINITLVQKCLTCTKEQISLEENGKNICCKLPTTTLIKVKIGIDIGREGYNVETVKLLSIHELDVKFQNFLEIDENKKNLDLGDLREYNLLFWNLVWHFNKIGLPYKFFVPYEEVGRNSFKITLHDDKNQEIDLTPQNSNDKSAQTEMATNYLISILG